MELKAKLALLGTPVSTPASCAAPPAADVDPRGPEWEREATLEALRRKMAEILGRPIALRPPADPSRTSLPFERIDTAVGTLCRRLEALRPSHHVGRIPVDAAASSDPHLLALLALDPSLSDVDPASALFLDTETTGLAGAGVIAFLVGLAWFDPARRLHMEQFLLRSPREEPAMLAALRERVERASVLVTYNGKAFDLPLLSGRYLMNRLAPLPHRPHLDLLHVARRLHKQRLGMCRLVHLESDVLGFGRGPDVEGSEIGPRYAHFLRTGDEEALRGVVEHNALDVVSMAALVGLYGEPLALLHREDLVGLARTLHRARAFERAEQAANAALDRGVGPSARRVRAQIAKARGDRVRSLADFEQLGREIDDASVRLELAKLYEHFVKEPLKALDVVMAGTGEAAEAAQKRRTRLERKAARLASTSPCERD